jgi:aspartyl-tRNA(Asn)/glutamyl-tRNA(Gln) amidotransferase subunit B
VPRNDYETVIGLEVHVQLKTRTKLFCGCPNAFGSEPNSQTCPVCLGLPGVLPVMNARVAEHALRTALALDCRIANSTRFDRKNYFYPDLPKSYQISQYDRPFAADGHLDITVSGKAKRIGIVRVHVEEDAGKLVHPEVTGDSCERDLTRRAAYSFVDLNRTGVPLLEIVSAPDINTSDEAYEYLTTLKRLIQYLGVSDCDMEKGSLRCDANLSVRPNGAKGLGVKTEIKNLNSFKFVAKALAFESRRQGKTLADGGRIVQETRLWDQAAEVTVPMRSKEEAHDYRYFPEPDLVPIALFEQDVAKVRSEMPEFPWKRRDRFVAQHGIPEGDAEVLTQEKALADYFEETVRFGAAPKTAGNWVMQDVLREMNEKKISIADFPVTPARLAELMRLVENGTLTTKIARDVFVRMLSDRKTPLEIVADQGLTQINDDSAISKAVDEAIAANPKVVSDYRTGKKAALGFLVGQVMKLTGGKANARMVNDAIRGKLGAG